MFLSEIHLYPVKSLGGFAVQAAPVEKRGLQFDRRWMLVDRQGNFLTQREIHQMALIRTLALSNGGWQFEMEGRPPLLLDNPQGGGMPLEVTVWGDRCVAIEVSFVANFWFSEALGMDCRLVYMPEESLRPVEAAFRMQADDITSFSDGYPCLLVSTASLADLNNRLATPVPMNRFRPNLVISDTAPFEEDKWRTIQIGSVKFEIVKPCARCVVTTIDQATGQAGKEPLQTLATFRKFGNKIFFGQNIIPHQTGTVRVGDKVEVLKWL